MNNPSDPNPEFSDSSFEDASESTSGRTSDGRRIVRRYEFIKPDGTFENIDIAGVSDEQAKFIIDTVYPNSAILALDDI